MSSITEVAIGIVCRNAMNPRKAFDQDGLDELAASIKEHGIIEPLVVRQVNNRQHYELIAGERRWRAAKLAGLTSVPVRVIEADDTTTQKLMLVENLQRRDLSAIEAAHGYQSLRDIGMTVAEIAKAVGLAAPTISNAMRLLELPDATQEMISDGRLTASHGRELLKFAPCPGMVEAVAQLAVEAKMPVATLAAEAAPYNARCALVDTRLVSGDYNAGHRKECDGCAKRIWNLCTDDECAQRLAAEERAKYQQRDEAAAARQAHLETPEGKAEQRKETIERNKAIRADQAERMRYLRDGHAAPGWQRRALVAAVRHALGSVYADEARILGGIVGGELGEHVKVKRTETSHLEPLTDEALMQLLWEAQVAHHCTSFEWSTDSKIGEAEAYLRGPEPDQNQTETTPEPDPAPEATDPDWPPVESHETVDPDTAAEAEEVSEEEALGISIAREPEGACSNGTGRHAVSVRYRNTGGHVFYVTQSYHGDPPRYIVVHDTPRGNTHVVASIEPGSKEVALAALATYCKAMHMTEVEA